MVPPAPLEREAVSLFRLLRSRSAACEGPGLFCFQDRFLWERLGPDRAELLVTGVPARSIYKKSVLPIAIFM
jgi:hypothetical protein